MKFILFAINAAVGIAIGGMAISLGAPDWAAFLGGILVFQLMQIEDRHEKG